MPSRNFCDFCDKQIKDGEPYYSLNTGLIERPENDRWDGLSIRDRTAGKETYHKTNNNFRMIGQNCMLKILIFLQGLNNADDT